jgi:hypothetical protein
MAVKLVVLYPRPKDVEAFETVYNLTMCRWPARNAVAD